MDNIARRILEAETVEQVNNFLEQRSKSELEELCLIFQTYPRRGSKETLKKTIVRSTIESKLRTVKIRGY